jgi:hypothetical protein
MGAKLLDILAILFKIFSTKGTTRLRLNADLD